MPTYNLSNLTKSSSISFIQFVGEDGIFCALLNCFKTQLEVVGEALKTIRARTLKKLDFPPNYAELYDDDCPEFEGALYGELNCCIKHLISLLEYVCISTFL